jgi:hypothetical protein
MYRASEIEWQTIRTFGQWWGIVEKKIQGPFERMRLGALQVARKVWSVSAVCHCQN